MSDEPFPLGRALVKLASLAKDSSIIEDPLLIIRAGAQGQIPIYWRNSAQVATRLSNFKAELWKTDLCSRWMQICPEDLARLETSPQTDVLYFALTEQDRALLGSTPDWEASPGEAPPGTTEFTDDLGVRHVTEVSVFLGEPVFRHEVSYAAVTISRDQLGVCEADLQAYADTLTTAPDPTPSAPAVDQGQSTQETTAAPVVTAASPETDVGQVQQAGADTGLAGDGGNQSSAINLQWWEKDYPIMELAQNIGQILHDKNEKATTKDRYATSVRKISDGIRTRIADHERRTGSDRKAPSADTIRGRLTDWKFETK